MTTMESLLVCLRRTIPAGGNNANHNTKLVKRFPWKKMNFGDGFWIMAAEMGNWYTK